MSKQDGKKKKYYMREARRRTKEMRRDPGQNFEMRPRNPYEISKFLKKPEK